MQLSHSLSKSCLMRIMRLVSKSQRKVLSDFLSEPGNTSNRKASFGLFRGGGGRQCAWLLLARGPFCTLTRTPLNWCEFMSSSSFHLPTMVFVLFLPLSVAGLHCAHLGLGRGSHRNCTALVEGGGKQGGQR